MWGLCWSPCTCWAVFRECQSLIYSYPDWRWTNVLVPLMPVCAIILSDAASAPSHQVPFIFTWAVLTAPLMILVRFISLCFQALPLVVCSHTYNFPIWTIDHWYCYPLSLSWSSNFAGFPISQLALSKDCSTFLTVVTSPLQDNWKQLWKLDEKDLVRFSFYIQWLAEVLPDFSKEELQFADLCPSVEKWSHPLLACIFFPSWASSHYTILIFIRNFLYLPVLLTSTMTWHWVPMLPLPSTIHICSSSLSVNLLSFDTISPDLLFQTLIFYSFHFLHRATLLSHQLLFSILQHLFSMNSQLICSFIINLW